MSDQNEHSDTPGIELQQELPRPTTVVMNTNVTKAKENNPSGGETVGVRRNGSVRRRLSKQNATIEEPLSLLSGDNSESSETTVQCIDEHPEEGKEDVDEKPADNVKLQPALLTPRKTWATSKSLSRESNSTEYSDRSGTDLRGFVDRTLHKSEEDRKQLLEFEKELKNLILDDSVQSRKFELPSSYHRMLLHRCAAWFGLDHNVTNTQTDIVVNKSDRTKIPEEAFSDYIRHDNYAEDRFKRQNTGGSRKELHHMDSLGDQTSQFGSQTSLNHDLLMMRRAQSFDVPSVTNSMQATQSPQPSQSVRGLPMRQLSLNCTQHPMVAAPMSGHAGHQWAPQRSFDCSNNSYLCTGKHQMMRKAESFGGMANGLSHGYYEGNVQMVCQTPPSVMVHHHHHHAHVQATQPPQSSYTGYQVFEEIPIPSPNYQPSVEHGMPSPGSNYYDYMPHGHQQYARPIRYVQPDYNQRRPPSSGVQFMYGPPQYVPYQAIVHPEVEVIVDPVQTQPFPPVGHFVSPGTEQQGYSSSHQAENANRFIKASIDGGYGSMTQEADSPGNAEKVEDA